jgi:alkylation response protein AidB-like acyl-CoA dehydrogenase
MVLITSDKSIMIKTIHDFMEGEKEFSLSKIINWKRLLGGLKKQITDLRLFSAIIPLEYGGMGIGLASFCLLIEKVSKVNLSLADVIQNNGIALMNPPLA